jgi:putative glycosyltransferase (TIGR04348 family)
MKIRLITPAPAYSRKGNRVTALRWATLLRQLGHRVLIEERYEGGSCDLLVALHARRSSESVARFRQQHPELPLIVALTGTDLYQDIRTSCQAQEALEMATRLIVLQPMGVPELPERLRPKARVIYQSVERPGVIPPKAKRSFDVCVLGHLRPVKDPFRTARAARRLPPSSRVRVLHVGGALSEAMAEQAAAEMAENSRYRWLGELPRWQARQVLARSHLLSLTSEMEGGANVISEALAASVPIVASRISGSLGLLGADYPGYFPVGDTEALAALLERAERVPHFYAELQAWCTDLTPLVEPERERQTWAALLEELMQERDERKSLAGERTVRRAGV